MKSKRTLVIEQLHLMDEIRAKANINIVTCGNCGTVFLHKEDNLELTCFDCKFSSEPCDHPDLFYSGMEDSDVFLEDFQSVEHIKEHYEEMKLAIDSESVNIYIDNGEDEDVTNVCYWHLDEVEEDSDVAISIANAINLFHTDKLKLVETLFGEVK